MLKTPLPGALISTVFIGAAVLVSLSGPGRAFEPADLGAVGVGEQVTPIDSPALRAARAGGCRILSPTFEASEATNRGATVAIIDAAANRLENLVGASCANRSAQQDA